ncbi:MAG: transporter substrate-binding domain-containing protein [Azospirillaceae bacterium]|nr:transporter substrate-binding domain-containing protein [Azospirillaceae bacterium]
MGFQIGYDLVSQKRGIGNKPFVINEIGAAIGGSGTTWPCLCPPSLRGPEIVRMIKFPDWEKEFVHLGARLPPTKAYALKGMTMRKAGVAVWALMLAAIAGSASAAETPKSIVIATEGAYEPWNFTGPGGKLDGFEIDLANDFCARMKITCEIVAQDWDGLIPALTAKKFDAIMASLIITEKRLAVISFSEPYAPTAGVFMVDKSGPLADLGGAGTTIDLNGDAATVKAAIETLAPLLKGKTIGVQSSTAGAVFLEKYLKGVVTVREYKTTEQHDLDLKAGRLDGVFGQKSAFGALLDKPDYQDFKLAGPVYVSDVFGKGIAVGLRKDDTVLKAMFDKAIAAAKADGTIDRLALKWLKTTFN